jgi:A/G-specific adenine glycosylase
MREPDTNFSETLSDAIIGEIRDILLIWEKENYKEFPWRTTDQQWKSLIAEILLQRTKANNVVPVYEAFFQHFPSPEKLAQASEEEIQSVIYPLGLRWRTPLLKKLGEQLVQNQGELPRALEELRKLHGVGPYVASAWLGFHGGKRSVIIDANVVRWICRLVDRPMDGETRRKKWLIELADKLTPEKFWKEYNYAVLDFSMEICIKKPQCTRCPLGPAICLYRRKQLGEKR